MTKFQRKRYEHITTLVDDPANAGRVDDHTPQARRKVGVWRWLGIQKHAAKIHQSIVGKRVMDFGGSAGPIGYGAEIVDQEAEMKAPYDAIGEFGCIFTSHTLEHVPDVELCIRCLMAKLERGGTFIAYVPSWRAEHLRAENWLYHCQTFYLSSDDIANRPSSWLPLDTMLAEYLDIEIAEHSDHQCMIIIGEKR